MYLPQIYYVSVSLERIIQQSIALFSNQEDVVKVSLTWVVFSDRLHPVMPYHSLVTFLIFPVGPLMHSPSECLICMPP